MSSEWPLHVNTILGRTLRPCSNVMIDESRPDNGANRFVPNSHLAGRAGGGHA
jgi:hypothetical protein